MDPLAHGLFANAGRKLIDPKGKKKVRPILSIFWGIFPDIAFTLIAPFYIVSILSGRGYEIPKEFAGSLSYVERTFYLFSHSLVVALSVILLFTLGRYLIKKKWKGTFSVFPIEMLGWVLHIVLDIPTHSREFYATKIFWPFTDWGFDGIGWRKPEALIGTYGILIIIYLGFFLVSWYNKKHKKT